MQDHPDIVALRQSIEESLKDPLALEQACKEAMAREPGNLTEE